MKITRYIFIVIIFCFGKLNAQSNLSSTAINGAYTSLIEERGMTGPSKNKVIQLGENNGTEMLLIAACDKCMPGVYTYNQSLSHQFGKPVFNNNVGLYVLYYDDESFVIVMPSLKQDEDFSFYNFYSKNQSKVKEMTKDTIESYASKLLGHL